jgi:hypothetical protein
MTQDARDIETTFQRAWALLAANPIIVVPGLIMTLVAIVVAFIAITFFVGAVLVTGATHSTSAGAVTIGTAALIAVVLVMLVAIVQTGWVTGMAGVAWERGTATLGDGWSALGHRAGEIFLVMLILLPLGIIALLLALPTLLLSLLAFYVFFIYAIPAVVIGGHSAGQALSESCRMAARNFWPTVGIAAIVICVSFIAAMLGGEIARLQLFAGGLISAIVQSAALAYTTLVIVGEYVKLNPAQPVAAPPPP